MSKADKLFKYLKYRIYDDDLFVAEKYDIELIFSRKNKYIWITAADHILTMEDLKAINMKCKELGWEV